MLRMMVLLVSLPVLAGEGAVPRAECISGNGQTACGYGCASHNGQVRCAQRPGGKCQGYNGTITCFDPPERSERRGCSVPAECVSGNGQTACGYGCASHNGQVRCAQRPGGKCQGNNGTITCFDPPFEAFEHQPVVQAECVSSNGQTACGYGCASHNGQVRCAQRPGGMCQGANGTITCSQ